MGSAQGRSGAARPLGFSMAKVPARLRHPARKLRSAAPPLPARCGGPPAGARPGEERSPKRLPPVAAACALLSPAAAAAGFSSATTWAPPAAHAPAAAGSRGQHRPGSPRRNPLARKLKGRSPSSLSSSLPCLCREREASRDLPNCRGTRANPGASKREPEVGRNFQF